MFIQRNFDLKSWLTFFLLVLLEKKDRQSTFLVKISLLKIVKYKCIAYQMLLCTAYQMLLLHYKMAKIWNSIFWECIHFKRHILKTKFSGHCSITDGVGQMLTDRRKQCSPCIVLNFFFVNLPNLLSMNQPAAIRTREK